MKVSFSENFSKVKGCIMSHKSGLKKTDLNNAWEGKEHENERLAFVYKLITLKPHRECYGTDHCTLCGVMILHGDNVLNINNTKIICQIDHFVEYHGHRPKDEEIALVNRFFERYQRNILEAAENELPFLKEEPVVHTATMFVKDSFK